MTQDYSIDEYTNIPPPPRRSLIPEQTCGTTSAYTINFSAEEISDAQKAWLIILKGTLPSFKEQDLQQLALDKALAELQGNKDAVMAAAQAGANIRLQAHHQAAATPPPTQACDINTLATYLPAKQRKYILGQITPVATDRFPEPSDLGAFWL